MLDGPIVVRGQVVGVAYNESINIRKKWTIEEQKFAASVADIAALVIQSKERAELERLTLQGQLPVFLCRSLSWSRQKN
jgi:GAF domain-containing protein